MYLAATWSWLTVWGRSGISRLRTPGQLGMIQHPTTTMTHSTLPNNNLAGFIYQISLMGEVKNCQHCMTMATLTFISFLIFILTHIYTFIILYMRMNGDEEQKNWVKRCSNTITQLSTNFSLSKIINVWTFQGMVIILQLSETRERWPRNQILCLDKIFGA